MDKNKLKPNLVDPILQRRIIKTLSVPPPEDYWEPTKNTLKTLYQKYIKENIYLVVAIIFVIFLLLYRYHITKKKRQQQILDNEKDPPKSYADLLMDLYKQEKEYLREPTVKKFSSRVDPAPITPKFAYPIYPYAKGVLAPTGGR